MLASSRKNPRWRWLGFLGAGALGLGGIQGHAQIEDNHVVKIEVQGETPGGSAATGFLWKNSKQAVTSLHAVLHTALPGKTIMVYCLGAPSKGTVTAVLKRADLVLLSLDRPLTGCKVFEEDFENVVISELKPGENAELKTLGWKGAASTAVYRDLKKAKVAGNVENLDGLLDTDKARETLETLDLPALDLDIYLVKGDALGGGFSGGPVVDEQGALIGVVDGGLAKGGGDYNWVVPAYHLQALKKSDDKTVPRVDLTLLDKHFSAGLVRVAGVQSEVVYTPRSGDAAAKSNYHFVKTKTLMLWDKE